MGLRGHCGRFILRYTGDGPRPKTHVALLRQVPGTKVLSESDKMLLVEGPQQELEAAARALDGWVLASEKTVPIPDTRKKVKRRPR